MLLMLQLEANNVIIWFKSDERGGESYYYIMIQEQWTAQVIFKGTHKCLPNFGKQPF
jgi:hypothetical protein